MKLEDFGVNKLFITSLLKTLWEYPESIFHILINSDNKSVKNNLAPFIVNHFYCNYLSGNYIENNLLYVITLMLKDEIDKLENINQVNNFLEKTKCGFILEELIKMPDIQIYFKNVILKTVEKIERTCSFREIKFNSSEILKELIKLKDEEEKKTDKKNKTQEEIYTKIINSNVIDPSINFSRDDNNIDCQKRNDLFVKKYTPNLGIEDLGEYANKAKDEKNNNLLLYFNKLENDIKSSNNPNLYSNKILMQNMLISSLPAYIVTFYQNNFLEVISFVEQLIKDLMNNIFLLPNSIKYICKIISILIKKKFKNITKIEENAFISRFLIGKLLIPIISLPNFNSLICDFIISGNTLKNIKIINIIIEKLFSGQLFKNDIKEADYTPFNWFFLDKIETILLFFEKIENAYLPPFIDKCINNTLPKDYTYEYFNENKGQIYAKASVCFSVNDLYCLLNGLQKCSYLFKTNNPKAQKLQKSFERLNTEETINEIKRNDENIIKMYRETAKKKEKFKDNWQDIEIQNFYLFKFQEIEKKYENLFSINNKIANFYIDIKKMDNNKQLSQGEKNIIKVKNYLCNSLGNFRILNKYDFNIGSTSNTIKMLNEIKFYMSLPNFILNNNTIPSLWYINSILDYLNKIPENYKKNDFKNLFNELTQNLNNSINDLDFEKLILFRNKLKFLDKVNNYYTNAKQLFNNITINETIKHIVEDVFIPIDLNYKYDDSTKIFELTKSNIKEKLYEDNIIYETPKKNIISFRTIEAFTRYFPNLAKYQLLQGINPLDIIKELSINQKLNDYFKIIKEKVKIIVKKDKKKIYIEKIEDYIMNKIYEKIYPPEPDDKDSELFKKSMQLSWVEPHYFVKKDYIYDNLLPDILNEFKQINIVKTPNRKYKCIINIFEYIKSLIKFNEGLDKENIGADDVIPVLSYIFIKAHPFRIFTDLEFIKIFLKNEYDYEINQIQSIFDLLNSCTSKSFNLTPEEYNKRCIEASNDNKKKDM